MLCGNTKVSSVTEYYTLIEPRRASIYNFDMLILGFILSVPRNYKVTVAI